MLKIKIQSLAFVMVLLIVSSCSNNQTISPTQQISTPDAPPISTPTTVAIAMPLAFIDSGQRLGSGRSWDVSLGDLDGDGDLDAFVANGIRGEIGSEVWINNGMGIFTLREQDLGYGMGVDLGDLDGDGDLDVFIVGWEEVGRVWLNDVGQAFLAIVGKNWVWKVVGM